MRDARLTQKDVALFFFPLLLNVQLMSVSHSIINAGLARLDDAVVVLAGFSVAMVLHLFVASPSYQNHTITIAMVRGRKSLIGMTLFVLSDRHLGLASARPARLQSGRHLYPRPTSRRHPRGGTEAPGTPWPCWSSCPSSPVCAVSSKGW